MRPPRRNRAAIARTDATSTAGDDGAAAGQAAQLGNGTTADVWHDHLIPPGFWDNPGMANTASPAASRTRRSSRSVRDEVGHPIVDIDGHVIEHMPSVLPHLRESLGADLFDALPRR